MIGRKLPPFILLSVVLPVVAVRVGPLRGFWNLGLYSVPLIHFTDCPWCVLSQVSPLHIQDAPEPSLARVRHPRPFQQWFLTPRLSWGLAGISGPERGNLQKEVWDRGMVSLFLETSIVPFLGEPVLQVFHGTTRCRCFLMDGKWGSGEGVVEREALGHLTGISFQVVPILEIGTTRSGATAEAWVGSPWIIRSEAVEGP